MLVFLTYDVKVAVLIAVFYMFYRLLLAKETFHRVNRVVLLVTSVLSFVLPLCVITLHQTVVLPLPEVTIGEVQATVATEEAITPWWQVAVPILFIIGMVVTLGHTLMAIVRILLLIRRSEQHLQPDGITLCVTDRDLSPFSFCCYIVMSRRDFDQHDEAVLAHERGHIRLRHSWDLLLVDTLTALQWFNPAMWMLRQDLRAIHEYEADGAGLSQGFNARQYQYLLITKAASIGGYSIAPRTCFAHTFRCESGISHSTLKNRIHMMLHKKSSGSHLLKLLALVPIVGTALALNARTVTDYVYDEPQKKQVIKKGKQNATVNAGATNDIVVAAYGVPEEESQTAPAAIGTFVVDTLEVVDRTFDVVEQMPQFPGGPSALMQFLGENIRYPEEAHKAGVQGRVIVTFVVEKDGRISEPRVVKSVSPELDGEAVRVVSAMPNWMPGRQNGKAVRVKYTVPITFKLQDNSNPAIGATVLGKEHKGKEFEVVIDGELVDVAALNGLDPRDIESMKVEKAKDGQSKDRMIITMKKKN